MKYLKFAILCFIWSTTWAMIKIGLDQTPPMVGLALRFSVAAMVLGGIILWKRRRIPFDRASVQNYFVVGLMTMALSYFCTYYAEQYIPSGLTSILWTSLPILVGIFARFMLPNERMRRLQILAIAVAVGGVLVILSDQKLIFSLQLLWGGLIALAGVAVSGWPNVYLKMRREPYDSLTMTAMAMVIAAGVHLIGATLFGEWTKMVWDFKNVGSIVYLGLFGSAIAFYVYYDLLQQINVVKLTFVTFITPVFATLIGALWLHETVTWRELGGMVLIFAGLVLYDGKKYLTVLKSNKSGRARA
jgi:drug/metabolite transporter (DMT)-like permease